MNPLYYIPADEFTRLRALDISDVERAKIFSSLARINTLYMIAKAGSGHIGSSFSSMEIFSWLYLSVLGKDDLFFSSKGHDSPGLYSVLIGLEKLDFDLLHKLRRIDGLPGHPDVSTPGIVTNTGSLGMGVSKAKGFVFANRRQNVNANVFVLTGDGELQEGQFWESLPGAVNRGYNEIVVIVDHNKIQSDTWIERINDLGDLEAKFSSFGWHVERCDGNNLEEFSQTLSHTLAIKDKPKVIIADTVKGCGVSFMESSQMKDDEEFYSFHSGAPGEEDYEKAAKELISAAEKKYLEVGINSLKYCSVDRENPDVAPSSMQRLIPAYEAALLNTGKKNENVVVLDADLMIDCGLLSFRNHFPKRFIECGIAEQDMVSQAGAIALSGMLPIAHSFSCFLAPRANEQIYNNASEHTKCIYTGSLSGVLPGGPGHSHQSVRDISALSGVPELTLLEPSCEKEVYMILDYAVNQNEKSTYIRLTSIPYEVPFNLPPEYILEEGKGVPLTQGEDAVLFAYGIVSLSEAVKASHALKEQYNFGLKVMNLPWLNRINSSWLVSEIGDIGKVYSLDNHYIQGGQGELIGATLAESGQCDNIIFQRLGLRELPKCGRNEEVLQYHAIGADDLVGMIKAQHLEFSQ